jgi:hypothetical protein
MSAASRLSVAILGPDIDHRKSLEAMTAGRVRDLIWLSDSNSLLQGRSPSKRERIQRAIDQLTHTHNKQFLANTCRQLDEHQTEVIVAYWGTLPLPDLAAIKRLRPHVKIVLMVVCYPLAFDNQGIRRQFWFMRHAIPNLDGMIFPSEAMHDYFRHNVFEKRGEHIKSLVLKPCWPQSYQISTGQIDGNFQHPNVIFVGRTDLSHGTIHQADDLRPLMADILRSQIELHHVWSKETADGNPWRKTFAPLDQPGLIAKMRSHDASLIAYNGDACQRTDRLNLTVPDRLLTSVAAGTPVAVPKEGYAGSKQYLSDYPAVFEFESASDLKNQLTDREHVQAMREAAWNARGLYTAERQGEHLVPFLEIVRG